MAGSTKALAAKSSSKNAERYLGSMPKYRISGYYLSSAPHCLQRDFIPVSIDQVRLMFTTELNHSILPCPVDQEAPRFKGKLGRNAAWPFFQDVQKRVIFHHHILP